MSAAPSPTSSATPARSWRAAWLSYTHPAALRMAFLGFAAGLPFLLLFGTLSFWLREAGIDKTTIGHLSWVGLLFAFKWVWAPLVDKVRLPLLGRLGQRRSWLLLAQGLAIAALIGMALNDPQKRLSMTVYLALALAFASATQDIALDAFRIESAAANRQAVLAANYQMGYRVAMICAGAGVLKVAAFVERSHAVAAGSYSNAGWRTAYLTMAAAMLVGVVTVLFSREPAQRNTPDAAGHNADPVYLQALNDVSTRGVAVAGMGAFALWVGAVVCTVAQAAKAAWLVALQQATGGLFIWLLVALATILTALTLTGKSPRLRPAAGSLQLRVLARLQASFVAPFADFFQRYRWHAALILGLISIYRISDVVMGNMANQFYVDMHFSKDQVALVSGILGIAFTLLGTFIGGLMCMRWGVMRVLMLGAVLASGSNLLFVWLSGYSNAALDLWKFDLFGQSWSMPRALTLVIAADNISSGIASAAFIAYLSGLTSVSYSATQYALFSSIMLLLPKYLGGFGGTVVNSYGYGTFFTGTAMLGVPVLVLVWLAGRVLVVGEKDTN